MPDGSLSTMETEQGYGSQHPADRHEVVHEESFITPVHEAEAKRKDAHDTETALYAGCPAAAPNSPWADTAAFLMNKALRANVLRNLATTLRDRQNHGDPVVPLAKQKSLGLLAEKHERHNRGGERLCYRSCKPGKQSGCGLLCHSVTCLLASATPSCPEA